MEELAGIEQKEKLPLRVLIAEDDPNIRRLFEAFLKLRYDHVDVVENGIELMEKLTEPGANYDCIVSDDNMPGRQGMEILEEISVDERFKNVAFVLVTGRIDLKVRNRVMEIGGVYLNKPVTKDKLYEAVDFAVNAKKQDNLKLEQKKDESGQK